MRRLIATIIAVGAVIPTMAFAAPNQVGGTKAPHSAGTPKPLCKSNACHRRVAVKKRAKVRASCRSISCKRRVAQKRAVERKRAFIAPYRGWLASTRQCESGGNYSTNTGNGFYGAYQFTLSTWASVGGQGNPAYASPLEQDYRAVILLRRSGAGQWPVCG